MTQTIIPAALAAAKPDPSPEAKVESKQALEGQNERIGASKCTGALLSRAVWQVCQD